MSSSFSIDYNAMKEVIYAHVIRHLAYLTMTTQTYISYSMGHCAQFMSNPSLSHWSVIKKTFLYLQFI
jgi:hypothetical protein